MSPQLFFLKNSPQNLATGFVDDFTKSLKSTLSADELSCLSLMESSKRQTEFLLGHALVRFAVSHFLSKNKGEIKVSFPAGQAPVVENDLCFVSLSHTDQAIAVVVSAFPVGVDIDKKRRVKKPVELALSRFHPKEAQWVKEGVDLAESQTRFIKLWTLKEAFFKAINDKSIATILNADRFEVGSDASVRLFSDRLQTDKWTFGLFDKDEIQGAFSIHSSVARVDFIDLEPKELEKTLLCS